jgi:hypothetical protein
MSPKQYGIKPYNLKISIKNQALQLLNYSIDVEAKKPK